jgi:hypothetical protein
MHGIGMDAPLETSEITDAFVQNKSAVGDLRSLKQQKNMESNGQNGFWELQTSSLVSSGLITQLTKRAEPTFRSGFEHLIQTKEDAPDNLT